MKRWLECIPEIVLTAFIVISLVATLLGSIVALTGQESASETKFETKTDIQRRIPQKPTLFLVGKGEEE